MRRLSILLLASPLLLSCAAQPPAGGPANPDSANVTLTSGQSIPGQELPATSDPSKPATAGRQIIYRAAIDLHVEDFSAADRQIKTLVNAAGGYIAQFQEHRPQGAQRGGRWTIRVPVDRFDTFLDAVGQLGIADRREVQSQDMTEEFVDLSSRLKNKQALESRLLELVAKRGDAIKDILALEVELSRVREEIERIQGRLRYLSDRVALTTVEITAYERLDYRPPETTLLGRIASTFHLSLHHLGNFGEALLLLATALLPWTLALALILLPLFARIRRRHRRSRQPVINASLV